MKPQEDIGSFIKAKLQSAEKASREDTWDRIQSSLEKRKKKKRAIFFLKWSSIIALLVISGLLIVYSNSATPSIETTVQSESETNSSATPLKLEDTPTSSNKEENSAHYLAQEEIHSSNDMQDGQPKNDSTLQENTTTSKIKIDTTNNLTSNDSETITKQSSEIAPTTSNNLTSNNSETITKQSSEIAPTTSAVSSNDISPNKDITQKKPITSKDTKEPVVSNTIDQDTIVNRNDVPVTHTTKKIYYYYNSKNGQEISSPNKSVIDSIVKANEPKQDSLKMD